MSLRQRNTRTAGVYGANPDPAMRNTPRRSGSRSPGRGSGGLPSLREARDKWVGGGVGSREELEAALSSTQTQLMMAKQRIEVLEQQNAALRAAAAEAKTKAATAASGSSPPKDDRDRDCGDAMAGNELDPRTPYDPSRPYPMPGD